MLSEMVWIPYGHLPSQGCAQHSYLDCEFISEPKASSSIGSEPISEAPIGLVYLPGATRARKCRSFPPHLWKRGNVLISC